MMNVRVKKVNKPSIRFVGFTDDWEKRKLSEIVSINNGKDYKNLNYGSVPVYGTGGIITFVDTYISSQDSIGIGRKGTIDSPMILKAPFWTVDTLFYSVPINQTDLNFAFDIFLNINWKKYDESTGVPSLSKKVIGTIEVLIPGFNEQTKLGKLLKEVDKLITVNQRKGKQLSNLKKALLQKMFVSGGKVIPDIRFKGFIDDWEKRKFSEVIIKETKGKAKAEMSGGTSTYLETGFLNGGVETFVDSPRDVNEEDVLILWDGSQAGKTYYGFSGALGSTLKGYKVKENGLFIYQYFQKNQSKIFSKYRTPNIPHVIKNFTEVMIIPLPTKDEQNNISSFINKLDNLITVNQRKTENLKNMKKALLQKMFI